MSAVLVALEIADPPDRWRALGFAVDEDGRVSVGGVRLTLGVAPAGDGIVGWSLSGLSGEGDIDGLATRPVSSRDADGAARSGDAGEPGRAAPDHANGAVAIDHVVVTTPDLERLAAILAARGLPLRRRVEIRGARMGFRRLGGPILEVVEDPRAGATGFWGVTFAVADPAALDALGDLQGLVGPPRPAVQPGRRIATVAREAGLSTPVAFIDPER